MGCRLLREGTFLIGGGGGGLRRGGSLVNFLQIGGGPNLFCSQLGEGHTFFSKEENYSADHVAFIKVDSFILFA